MIKYITSIDDIKQGFKSWLESEGHSQNRIKELIGGIGSVLEYEQRCNKLLPNFEKEDIENYIQQNTKGTITVIRKFYTKSKIWIKYCNDNGYYSKTLTNKDIESLPINTVQPNKLRFNTTPTFYFKNEDEFEAVMKKYVDGSGDYLAAITAVLSWCGVHLIDIGDILLTDCNIDNGTIINDTIKVKLENEYFRYILNNAVKQKTYTTESGQPRTLVKSDKLIRTSFSSTKNKNVINKSSIRFATVLSHYTGVDISFNKLYQNGKFVRMYLRETNHNDTNIRRSLNYDVLNEYLLFLDYLNSNQGGI